MKSKAVLWWVLAGLATMAALGGGGYVVYTNYKQRGIRNNNPGNIEFNQRITWRGQVGKDGVYLIFDTPQNGIRAMALDLRNKMARGLNTIEKIITVYAPPKNDKGLFENDTPAYIKSVAAGMGVAASAPLSTNHISAMVAVMIKHENGINPYPADLIGAGVSAALAS